MQLAATRGGKEKRCSGRSQLVEIESGFQPCEPKPRPAEARRHSLRGLRHENNTAPTEAELANLQRALFLNKANAACGSEPGDSRSDDPPCRETAARATLRIAKTISEKKRLQTTANEQRFSFKPPRHYTASGLLNLLTTLAQAVACTTPGIPTAFRGKPYGRTNYRR